MRKSVSENYQLAKIPELTKDAGLDCVDGGARAWGGVARVGACTIIDRKVREMEFYEASVFLKHTCYKNLNEPKAQARKTENQQSPFS